MKKTLIIGSTVVDIVIRVDHLPTTSEDVHTIEQHMSLGGCAYNASDILNHFQVPYTLFSPIGTGTYGHFVREALKEKGITSPIPTPVKENGCCYCFIENSGERTFISHHGAEYLFEKEWFDKLDCSDLDQVYVCGLEIEETTGDNILDFLEQHPDFTIFFASGPRVNALKKERLARILALSPILHLNEQESLDLTGKATYEEAALYLHQQTSNTVIITLGAKGAYYFTGATSGIVSGVKATQVDTIGAGDSHIGAVMACMAMEKPIEEALESANHISAAVVEVKGALLSPEQFQSVAYHF